MVDAGAKRAFRLSVAVWVVLLCGGSGSFGAIDYAHTYLRIAAPVDQARFRFDDNLAALGSNPSKAQLRKIAMPLAGAIRALDPKLIDSPWPPRVEPVIRSLVRADRNLLQALDSGAQHRRLPSSRWEWAIIDNTGVVNSADSMVHARLGLPPPY